MTRGSFILFAFGVVLLSLGGAPFLLPMNHAVEQLKSQHAAEIASLSQSDRARIVEKNFPAFRDLPPASQVAYIDLHSKLEADRAGSKTVVNAMQTYDAWLKTLKPSQREELLKTTDPLQRVELTRQYVQGQREERAQVEMKTQIAALQEIGMSPQFAEGLAKHVPVLDSETLARVMAELETITLPKMSAANVSRLRDLTGMARWLEILRIVKEENIRQKTGHFLSLPTLDDMHRLVAVIEDSSVREWMNEADARARGFKWHTLLQKSMFLELDRHHQTQNSSAETLRKSFDSLSKDEQEELLGQSAADFVDHLTQSVQEQGAEVTRGDIRMVFEIPRPPGPGPGGRWPSSPEEVLRNLDKNQDGQIQRAELDLIPEQFQHVRQRLLKLMDEKKWDSLNFERLKEASQDGRFFPGEGGFRPGRPGEGGFRPNRPGEERGPGPFGERPPFGPPLGDFPGPPPNGGPPNGPPPPPEGQKNP